MQQRWRSGQGLGDTAETMALRQEVVAALAALKRTRPRLHAIAPHASAPLVANVAAAMGLEIAMTADADEAPQMAATCDAAALNLGMMDAAKADAVRKTARALANSRVPWLLDPVKVERSPARLELARALLAHGPALTKGNRAEIGALRPDGAHVITGARDTIVDGAPVSLSNGDAALPRVIGTGCAAGVVCAALLPCARRPAVAAVAGLTLMNVAAEEAARHARGPGRFAAALLDALSAAVDDPARVAALLRVAEPIDLSVYLIMGPDLADPVGLAKAAVAGGATIIQWRDKDGDTADQVRAVKALKAAVSVPVVVNDRVDVALAAGADGVHVGHGDLTPAEARALLGDTAIVGLTVHTLGEAQAAEGAPIDYASVGGVFVTTSKTNPNPPIGINGFCDIADRLRRSGPLPIVAIAGMNAVRAREVVAAGADGVALMSAITQAAEPADAARAIAEAVADGRQDRED